MLTVSPRKISWHGTNGVLIINNKPDRRSATLFHDYPYGAGKEAWRQLTGERVSKCNLISDQKNTPTNGLKRKQKRSALAPLCNILYILMAFHHERNNKTACTSSIALSFPFPFPVVCPLPPPSKHAPTARADSVCSREEKCWLTAQRQAYRTAWALGSTT